MRPASAPDYDVVVVGGRPAGAATAMLLARRGLRVLVLDRGTQGSDTLSTHALMRPAVMQLERWGLLPQVASSSAPPIRSATFDTPSGTVEVPVSAKHGVDALYAPRRTELDSLLVDAARQAGAEVRHRSSVQSLLRRSDGRVEGVVVRDHSRGTYRVRAAIIVGADGVRSTVAKEVGAGDQVRTDDWAAFSYTYWSGLPVDGYQWFFRSDAFAGAIPTNDGQHCVFVGAPHRHARELLTPDPARGYDVVGRRVGARFTDLLSVGRPVGHFRRFGGLPGHLRTCWGPGWVLVGDSGFFRDPIGAHGITDALRDAELCAHAVADVLGLLADERVAMSEYELTRNQLARPLLETSARIASGRWADDEIDPLLRQLNGVMRIETEVITALPDAAPRAA